MTSRILYPNRRALLAGGLATGALALLPVHRARANVPAKGTAAGSRPFELLNLIELEERARGSIPAPAFAFISNGAGDEWSLRENRLAFDRREIYPRVYAGVGHTDTNCTLLGTTLQTPLIAPPTMGHGLVHESAEVGTARGVEQAGGLMVLSTLSTRRMEDVAQATKGPRWFQLYQDEDDGVTRELLWRARDAGYTAIVHTVDVTMGGNREANIRTGFTWPKEVPLGNFPISGRGLRPKAGLSWKDLELVQKESALPVIPKGILRASDAAQAVRLGAAGIWLSNHGGRQLDGAPSAFTVLPRAAEAVEGRVPIILDGGVRRGLDVFKSLALGATAVALGRPTIYGLALGGEEGVRAVYEKLTDELRTVMHLSGTSRVQDIGPDMLQQ
ncbi:alpha-hydroxy-acid oxidizing protein [Altererythrobacter fulvus]|uniref:alpha-hydroxy-acid oxidizing protein n=1 Tax=Caenibius fulvus TaxID=2126012 RepID=UPI003016AC38